MTEEQIESLIWRALITGRGHDIIKMMFRIGYNQGMIKGMNIDLDEYMVALTSMRGIDLEAEMAAEGYEKLKGTLLQILEEDFG